MEDPPVRHGYLLTPPQGKLLKRTWQRKYYALYRASNYAVERVEVFDNEDGFHQLATSKRIIPLNDCVKVVQVPQKNQQNVFEVRTKKQVYQFSSETTQELAEWVSAFQMVAFGGRRDLGSPLTMGSVATPYSSPSQSLLIKAEEEENQIYSSCSWTEYHYIQIVETEASNACGLYGKYVLIVSPLQLLLFDDAANVSTREPLFVWPYRHIRRYGRSKDAFTFEAGRKCSSGEGTFTFATSEANIIFLRVQTNTRTLKREGEDVASFTPTLLLNKPLWSTPSLDLSDHRSKGDQTPETTTCISLDGLSRPKIIPPFPKPSRKTKIPSISDEKTTSPTEPIRLEISNAARAKLAAETMMNNSLHSVSSSLISLNSTSRPPLSLYSSIEPTYALPEVRKDAWKTFGLESDNIHSEKVPDVPDTYYASVPISPNQPVPLQFTLPLKKDQVNRILSPPPKKTSDNNDDYCYDHLAQFGTASKSVEASPDGHIYSRLLSVSSNPPEQQQLQQSSSQQNSLANYEEVLVPEILMPETISSGVEGTGPGVGNTSGTESEEREDIKRFVQNDDVYTVVSKKSVKHSNNSQSENHTKN